MYHEVVSRLGCLLISFLVYSSILTMDAVQFSTRLHITSQKIVLIFTFTATRLSNPTNIPIKIIIYVTVFSSNNLASKSYGWSFFIVSLQTSAEWVLSGVIRQWILLQHTDVADLSSYITAFSRKFWPRMVYIKLNYTLEVGTSILSWTNRLHTMPLLFKWVDTVEPIVDIPQEGD
jgi:hypothetical protein